MANVKGYTYRDDRFTRRMDAVSETAFTLICKGCGQQKQGRYFDKGDDHTLCAECDPGIFKCSKCGRYKEKIRFSRKARLRDELLCYRCDKGYVYLPKKEATSYAPVTPTRLRACLRCDKQFKSINGLRICKECKLETKYLGGL